MKKAPRYILPIILLIGLVIIGLIVFAPTEEITDENQDEIELEQEDDAGNKADDLFDDPEFD